MPILSIAVYEERAVLEDEMLSQGRALLLPFLGSVRESFLAGGEFGRGRGDGAGAGFHGALGGDGSGFGQIFTNAHGPAQTQHHGDGHGDGRYMPAVIAGNA